eukprot:5545441-Pleurochrysis_carterae.AAC.1
MVGAWLGRPAWRRARRLQSSAHGIGTYPILGGSNGRAEMIRIHVVRYRYKGYALISMLTSLASAEIGTVQFSAKSLL